MGYNGLTSQWQRQQQEQRQVAWQQRTIAERTTLAAATTTTATAAVYVLDFLKPFESAIWESLFVEAAYILYASTTL